MEVGSVVYRASGDSGVVMESAVHNEGFVSVLWESSDSITETSIAELSLHPTSNTGPRNAGNTNNSSSLSLNEKLQILTGLGNPEQREQLKQLMSQVGSLDDGDSMERRAIEGMVDQLLQGAEGRSTSSPVSVEALRAKLSMLAADDPQMLAMSKDQALDSMSPEQLADLNQMLDLALSSRGFSKESNVTEVEISSDFPDTSILKYFGKRPDARFAR